MLPAEKISVLRPTMAIVLTLALFSSFDGTQAAAPDEAAAREAGLRFGRALTKADATLLRPLLPRRGKVQMVLVRLGPEKGHFSGNQVETLFRDFLQQGSVEAFELERVECASKGYALVHGIAVLTDRAGRKGRSEIRLSLQVDAERWVLREIREAPR